MSTRKAIFRAGTKLFAERGYDSVGIRDIAREAHANSAMISYYFKGKAGLLREIFSAFSAQLLRVLRESMDASDSLEDLSETTVFQLLKDARRHPDLYRAGLRMFNSSNAALDDLQQDMQSDGYTAFEAFLARIRKPDRRSPEVKTITFTAMLGAVFSDYLLGGKAFIEDDSIAETYARTIADIFKYGMITLWD